MRIEVGRERRATGIADGDVPAAACYRASARKGRVAHDAATMVFNFALQRQHVTVTVHDAALTREDGGIASERRLERARGITCQPLDAFDAVNLGLLEDFLESFDFGLTIGNDQLAASVVVDAVLIQEGIERAAPLDAEPGPQRASGVVEPGVDDLRVARRDALTDTRTRFDDDHS